jgi:teichuronic acid exporter
MIKSFRVKLNGSTYWQDILWQASGNSLAQMVGILGMPVLTRLYSPKDLAVQSLLNQMVGILTGIMTWRYEYLIQLPKSETVSRNLLNLVLLLGVITFLLITPLFAMFRFPFAKWMGDSSLANWLLFAPLTAVLSCYSVALQHKVQRAKRFKDSGLAELINKLAYIGSGVLGRLAYSEPLGLMIATGVGALAKIVWLLKSFQSQGLNIIVLSKNDRERQLKTKEDSILFIANSYASLSSSMVISHLFANVAVIIPYVFVARTYGADVLGQFVLVMSTLYLPAGLIGNAIGQVYYQRAAEGWANGQGFSVLWKTTAKKTLMIGFPIYALVGTLSPYLYPLIFGESWVAAGKYAMIISVSAFFSFVSSPMDKSSLIVNVWWYLPAWHLFRVTINLILVVIVELYAWSFSVFLAFFVLQMSFVYLIDFWAEWRFSLLKTGSKNERLDKPTSAV